MTIHPLLPWNVGGGLTTQAEWDAMTDAEFAAAMAKGAASPRLARVVANPPPMRRRKQVPARVGEKPRTPKAPSGIKPRGVDWKERGGPLAGPDNYKGRRNPWSGLPASGAPRPPRSDR